MRFYMRGLSVIGESFVGHAKCVITCSDGSVRGLWSVKENGPIYSK